MHMPYFCGHFLDRYFINFEVLVTFYMKCNFHNTHQFIAHFKCGAFSQNLVFVLFHTKVFIKLKKKPKTLLKIDLEPRVSVMPVFFFARFSFTTSFNKGTLDCLSSRFSSWCLTRPLEGRAELAAWRPFLF